MSRPLRRLGAILLVLGVTSAVLVGIVALGVRTSMGYSYASPPPTSDPVPTADPAASGPDDRIDVAVVLGDTGSVTSDVLVPFEVFARSDRFSVRTVAARRTPAVVSGGLHVRPDLTFDEVTTAPDVVVVPAVLDPGGPREAALRRWIVAQAEAGSRVLGVCSGAKVLAATGLLEGRRATSFWSGIDDLSRSYPQTDWRRGERYVEDGPVTTTAGVTSGAVGALRLVEQLAGDQEARRIGAELAYPGWSIDGGAAIPVNSYAPTDLPYGLNVAFPWLAPTLGVGLLDGVGEIEVAAAAEVYSGSSFAARVVPMGAEPTVTTRHGLVLVVHPADATTPDVDGFVVPGTGAVDPRLATWASDRGLRVMRPHGSGGEFPFDPVLRDLAGRADRATAVAAAKFTEYPSDHLDLGGPAWPWRPTVLLGAAVALAVGAGRLTGVGLRAGRRGRARPSSGSTHPVR